ncbi:microprocessor complex subunit DGCR8-like [Adelges cooleyi]|uniref:microprocessor complex subunit DGCR8-like n=1 Tax=Adelges cooleyi TaxID=133065 RepID=UPI00217FD9B0|nr:microprocessor complex subunit DGCR8-like [Adelges cooleyi]
MSSNDSDDASDLEACPAKKIRLSNSNNAYLVDYNKPHCSKFLPEFVVQKKEHNIHETESYYDTNNPSTSNNVNVFFEESDLEDDRPINKFDDSDSDYVQISDGEFELEKPKFLSKNRNILKISEESDFIKGFNDDKPTDKSHVEDLNNDEVYDLLDEAFKEKNVKPDVNQKKSTITSNDYKEYEKIVLEEVCKNHFDILPENWIEATHKSGMPIYLHKKTRVVTLSRPYFLGPGNPKSHRAPLSAISCLQYRKALEAQENITSEIETQASRLGDMIIPNAKVETAQENIVKESLSHEELRAYCELLFKFKKVKQLDDNIQEDKFEVGYLGDEVDLKTMERPSLPDSTKLISFPLQTEDDKRCSRKREWIMNPNGKSFVSILHEYLQQALKTQPWYEFKELDNTETPYSATVILNDVQYGVGIGNSKKQAKLNAAQATLDILIPEMKSKIDSEQRNQSYPVIFDQIKVTDPRITEFCAKTTEPSPYAMLLVCLQRNFGECDISTQYKLNNRRRMLNQCTMTVGKHTASVPCKNKRDGKQKASQVILGLLHPHIDNWGSLLRLYGNRSIKNAKEKKQEEQEITQLQSKAAVNQPNFAILNKLKEEMLKTKNKAKLSYDPAGNSSKSMLVTTCPYSIGMSSISKSEVDILT